MHKNEYTAIGLMSGTSLDGLDIACCEFQKDGERWNFRIICAETIPYDPARRQALASLENASSCDFVMADIEYGHFLGRMAAGFISRNGLSPRLIASHGHTIFHRPEQGFTCQIGRGSAIAAETGIPVVCDFRTLDVALGGQGAPLVPIGDALLFSDYDYCLNIGGFANISHQQAGKRLAWDICPANIVLNRLAGRMGRDYDHDGELAARGEIIPTLLDRLNALAFYAAAPPKSLGKEWVEKQVMPLLDMADLPVQDLLATFCEHIAVMVARSCGSDKNQKLLVTGGGAFNSHLMRRIRDHASPRIIVPDPLTVNFKEALIFAFLGVLRMRGEVNCLKSVTGATRDSSSGAIY